MNMTRRWMHTVRKNEVHSEIVDVEDIVGLMEDGWFLTIPEAAATIDDIGITAIPEAIGTINAKADDTPAATIGKEEIVDPDATDEVDIHENVESEELDKEYDGLTDEINKMTKKELIQLAKEYDISIDTQDKKAVILAAVMNG